ncbi:hypothetical protein ACQUSR_09370 [Streptomyces sp. P1-3]
MSVQLRITTALMAALFMAWPLIVFVPGVGPEVLLCAGVLAVAGYYARD